MATPVDPEFKAAVKSYVELHDELAASAKHQRALRKQKNDFADAILQYMKKNDIDGCALNDGGKLIRKQSRRMEALKKEHIMDELRKVVDAGQAESVLVNIFSKRAVDTKDSLTRTRTRGGGGGDAST